ncbi:helix-turn-helix domain-containing protein [Methylococcus mesophilus]|uniref:helix-turn-helix domain-containing protein n=1 Tax=Methylococcus mesophilus TaxID=2993564 RepID=UPI00224AF7F3|nr:helix-turn-helix transcriptional regulator [Methylococcus mesophilus]UZR29774.1 helix-turn-helix transcriptional regulator [Methylococcus mesophilus]
MKTLDELTHELLEDPDVRREYDEMEPEFSIARELVRARAAAGLTQTELAIRMGTTQSVVARMESGARIPSWRSIERFAKALGGRAGVHIELHPAG